MILILILFICVAVTFAGVGYCFLAPLPEVPEAVVIDDPLPLVEPLEEIPGISVTQALQPKLVAPAKKVTPTAPKVKPPAKPAPVRLPPLTVPFDIVGVVTSRERSEVILQSRSQTIHLLQVGDTLPSPHQLIAVEKIAADEVVFRKGKQTITILVDPAEK